MRSISTRCPMLFLALAGMFVGACGSEEADPQRPADLIGQSFLSTSVTDSGEPRLVGDTKLTLRFAQRSGRDILSWTSGCNSFAADVEIEPDGLVVGVITGTEIGCPEPLRRQDDWLGEFFGSDPRYELGEGVLTLRSGNGEIELAPGTDTG